MSITFQCPHCKRKLKAPDSAAGKASPCPHCGSMATCPELVREAEVVLVSPGKSPKRQPTTEVPVAKLVSQSAPAVPVGKIVSPPAVPVAKIVSQPRPAVPLAKLVSTVGEPVIELDDDDDQPYALVNPPPKTAGDSPFESRRPCPACGEQILSSAAVCRFCGEVFDPVLKKGKVKKPKKQSSQTSAADGRDLVIGFLCFAAGTGLTLVSYAGATSGNGGGRYLVFYGLIIGGIAGMVRGMAGLARS